MAIVVPRAGAAADAASLRAHVMARVEQGVISKFAVQDQVVFVETIARTSVGKLDKKVLRARFNQ